MAALDARQVHHARGTTEQRSAGEHEIGHRLPAAFGDGARAVADALATFEDITDGGMRLEALEFLVRREIRVGVIQMHDEADGDEIVSVVIEE